MKKEPSKGWLEFRARAGKRLAGVGAALKRLLAAGAARSWRWLKDNFRLERREALKVVSDGLAARNPLLVLSIGIASALASSGELKRAVTMAVCVLAALVLAELLVSLTRNLLPQGAKWIGSVLIIGACVTAVRQVACLVTPGYAQAMEISLALVAVNCMVLTRVGSFACTHKPGYALLDAVSNGVGYGLALTVLGALRELLSAGTLWNIPVFGGRFHVVALAATPGGSFLLLGVLTALAQGIKGLVGRKGGAET